MENKTLKKVIIAVQLSWRQTLRRKGLFFRALLCWSIGCLLLTADEVNSYDQRLQIRGEQKVTSDVVIVQFKASDLIQILRYNDSQFSANHEDFENGQDSSYWHKELWHNLLSKILKQSPKNIGVSFYFGDQIGNMAMTPEDSEVFRHPKVIWASHTGNGDRFSLPLFANSNLENVGGIDFPRDEDGAVRRISSRSKMVPHLAEKLSRQKMDKDIQNLIHYRGGHGLFATYSLKSILNNRIPKDAFKNKIIIIGAENQILQTPLGGLSKAEVLAQVVDNLLVDRWITRGSNYIYFVYLFLIMLVSVLIMKQYPQTVALTMLMWLFTVLTAFSIWVFDSFYFWLPVVSAGIQIGATWIIFVGYQASRIERKAWLLQQEQSYREELEQLKNNFVSLISHDLKTPIAKIQAVLDRRISKGADSEDVTSDLKSMKDYSEELNKYIQSILKVLRVESRAFSLNKEIGDLNEMVEEALMQLRPLALEKNISITTQLEPLFSIEADLNLIKEVIINLVDNAIKYSPNGGRVLVKTFETENDITVEVTDDGPGIAETESEQVWNKFVRGKDQDLKTKGSGLGLYLVKYFVELHNGRVFLRSKVGVGTTVGFSLPIEEQNAMVENTTETAEVMTL